MDKLNCIKDYMVATKAYYLFWFGEHFSNSELQQYILEKPNIIGAKIAIISNIMLGIKEDLIENKGERNYHSKVFLNALEETVDNITTKVENGYKIGNYVFPNAETLVAIIRNKLAHGNFVIDFDHGRVIINHQGTDIVLSVYKLSAFITSAFQTMIRAEKTTKYERDMVVFTDPMVSKRTEPFKTLGEIKRVIKGYEHISFTLESLNDLPITNDCISMLEDFIDYYMYHGDNYKISDYYKTLCNFFTKNNCKLTLVKSKLTNPKDVNEILALLGPELLNFAKDSLHSQIETIGLEFQRKINPKLDSFNPLAANIKHLIILDAMAKKNTTNKRELGQFVTDNITAGNEIRFYYDEYGMVLIGMFNAFFVYPFDNIYDIAGGYTLDRKDGLNFAELDLSMINPTVITIDESPLIDAKAKLDGLTNKRDELINKINQQKQNLSKVQGKPDAVKRISQGITDLNNSLSMLMSSCVVADASYNAIKDDFTNNMMYFRNKAIIEGIRNSIAHGNYEFKMGRTFEDTLIVFNDIYEGKLTFKAEIKFSDFEKLFDINTSVLVKFIDKKLGIDNDNVLSKK